MIISLSESATNIGQRRFNINAQHGEQQQHGDDERHEQRVGGGERLRHEQQRVGGDADEDYSHPSHRNQK